MVRFIISLLMTALISACASIPTPAERRSHADTLAAAHDWRATTIVAGSFNLTSYAPEKIVPAAVLTIYIEGDGFAWVTPSRPSADPTPRDPLALRLALAHPAGNAAYLARPCQFIDAEKSGCAERYWTHARFVPEVIAATDQALDVLKARFGAQRLTLVGYSGGGAVAALLAARRKDVERLVTVSGNLDHVAWTTHHRAEPLNGSLNAADVVDQLAGLPQMHFVGGADRTIPPVLVKTFANRFPADQRPQVQIQPDFDHVCCWVERWGDLWRKDLP